MRAGLVELGGVTGLEEEDERDHERQRDRHHGDPVEDFHQHEAIVGVSGTSPRLTGDGPPAISAFFAERQQARLADALASPPRGVIERNPLKQTQIGRPDVSVIVIARDVREEVLACLASAVDHAGPVRVETLLVDNASSDGTAEAVVSRFPETQVIRLSRNEGLAARNHGLRAARGSFRMFLDSDALLTPDALPKLVAFLEHHPEVGLVGPRLVYPDGTLQLSTRRFPPLLLPFLRRPPLARFFEERPTIQRHLMAEEPHESAREVEYVLGACQLFRSSAQEAAGELDSWMFFGHDDADWCFRMRLAGFKIAYCPDATVVHDYRRSTAKRPFSSMALRFFWIFYRFQWKWRSKRRRLLDEGRRIDERGGALEPGQSPPPGF